MQNHKEKSSQKRNLIFIIYYYLLLHLYGSGDGKVSSPKHACSDQQVNTYLDFVPPMLSIMDDEISPLMPVLCPSISRTTVCSATILRNPRYSH